MDSILVTGASGFIGSFIVEEALQKGYFTWAAIRKSSSRQYLQDPAIHFIELDYTHPDILQEQLKEHASVHGAFTYSVHCAGLTKCTDKSDFDRINYHQTMNFIKALIATNQVPKLFVFISTLSVFGPIHEKDYQPITEHDKPQPNTAYGRSKLKTELYLESLTNFPYLILRPTGVYGPREKDYYMMAKSIQQHVDFSVGYKRQDITFVYVKDVVQAIFLGIKKGVTQRAFFLSDGKVYQSRTFSNLIIRELKATKVLRICAPLWLLKIVSMISEQCAKLRHTTSTLNTDKYRIMKQRNWRCDITPAINELGYAPQYQLDKGVKETIAWYKEAGWL